MPRLPSGADTLGAAPANPLLAPVLRQAKALGRQRALLDLQAIQRIPGLAGYWSADPAYLCEDAAGYTPASVGGVIGQVRDIGQGLNLGNEIIPDGGFDIGYSSLNPNGSELGSTNGVLEITRLSVGGPYYSMTLTPGKIYRCTLTVSAGMAPSFRVLAQDYSPGGSTRGASAEIAGAAFISVSFTITTVVATVILYLRLSGAGTAYCDNISVRALPGYPAINGVRLTS